MFRKMQPAAFIAGLALCSPLALAQQADDAGLRFLNPPGLPTPSGYSHAVEAPVGRTIHVSGQQPLDKDGKLVGAGDFAAQAEQVFANLNTALTAAGASFDDVVKLDIYVTDMSQLKALRSARDRYINLQQPPASTLVQVERFVREDAMIEIAATAVVRAPAR
ncbi:enamine deaminase RidA (YjgF/YER057c/UK114 family) [Luteimonas cucumeris]|uniref:Enamine deaminase RidA (YjgF/YER057c/UK114 family) n=1 Tax=Luteimonas cucumeris TaxID=985012 RepID=A0A562LAH5_9GAMM|nr:RidA family protein [Luteimonas cucumeris]TWI04608.1 enamine deaminase RidA (YjgF/YER057c/UK114 family) [Luteimonas cucumeris]